MNDNTQRYIDSLFDGSGHINPNDKKTSEKAPDYGGFLKIDGKVYRISGWVKVNKAGNKGLSIKLQELDEGISTKKL